ncbi:MAG: thiol reductase thioredoxin, partial [Proteobacteria bacterium]|nr:thiol reductase thioredoxin [Pseudomonadota bacterium]
MNGEIHLINDKTFHKEVLQETHPVLVEYWASLCDSFQMVSLALERIAQS